MQEYQHKKNNGFYECLRPKGSQDVLVQVQGILRQLVNGLCSGSSLRSSLTGRPGCSHRRELQQMSRCAPSRSARSSGSRCSSWCSSWSGVPQPEVDMEEKEQQQLGLADGQQAHAQQ